MDETTVVDSGERSSGGTDAVNLLKRIPLTKEYAPRIEWLWEHLKTCDYAFDDLTRGNSQFWVNKLTMPGSEHYEFGDDGYIMADGIIPLINANIHFALWNKVPMERVVAAGRELLSHLFEEYNLNRITAMVPVNNQPANRLSVLLKFRYEGELRKAFLFHKVYYNVSLYGLLREEFQRKEQVN